MTHFPHSSTNPLPGTFVALLLSFCRLVREVTGLRKKKCPRALGNLHRTSKLALALAKKPGTCSWHKAQWQLCRG